MLTYFVQYLLVMYTYLWYMICYFFIMYIVHYICVYLSLYYFPRFSTTLKVIKTMKRQKSKLIIWGPKIKDNLTKRQTCAAHEINFLISYS